MTVVFRNLKNLLSLTILSLSNIVFADSNADFMSSGQWHDQNTHLIWMRCAIGQKWTGNSCNGNPTELNWFDASDYFKNFNNTGFADHKDWRLPTIDELASLRHCSKGWAVNSSNQPIKVSLPTGPSINLSCDDYSDPPALDQTIFPNAPLHGWYWSNTSDTNNTKNAWGSNTDSGILDNNYKYYQYYVRAVRSE